MVGGLDVAAGAAQLISLADLTFTKLIPALRETGHVNQNIQDLHQELEQFRNVIKEVERVFGLRSICQNTNALPPARLNSLDEHLKHCRKAIKQLSKTLPQPREGEQNWAQQFFTLLRMKSDSGVISRMQQNVAVMRDLLLMWINLERVSETSESNAIEERRPSIVRHRRDNLRNGVERLRNGETPEQEASWQDNSWELAVINDAEEFLDADNHDVSLELGFVEPETEEFYTSMIDESKQDAREYCERCQYNEAAAAQYAVLSYSRDRQEFCNLAFHDERIELKILADLHILREHYHDAAEILLHLRTLEMRDISEVWKWDLDLAKAYLWNKKYKWAASYAQNAYKGRLNETEKSHARIIEALDLLQQIHLKKGLYREARSYSRKALLHALERLDQPDERLITLITSGDDADEVLEQVRELQTDEDKGALALQTFHIAIAERRRDIAEALWDAYVVVRENLDVPNSRGEPPLLSAIGLNYFDIVKWLLEKGCNPNVRKANDVSALMRAAELQSPEIVRLLLHQRADPCMRNSYGRTALHYAVANPLATDAGQCRIITSALLDKGGQELLETSSNAEMTALHEAAERGNVNAAELLLNKGANIEARDCALRTPLIVAVGSGQQDVVSILLEYNANVKAKNDDGHTAMVIAKTQAAGNAREIQKLIKDHGSSPNRQHGSAAQPAGPPSTTDRRSSEAPSSPSSNAGYSFRSHQDESLYFDLNQRAPSTVEMMPGRPPPQDSRTPRRPLDDDGASMRSSATDWARQTVKDALRRPFRSRSVAAS